ncbi:MAG TPA: TetR/AcrR family transcriptional regulator [Chloroflexota bacterium]
MNVSYRARDRVRAELTREIKEAARRQLSAEGAAALSLRAVARELGMASSAIYRYFPSRDDLLTALIVDAYNALGETAEAADASCPRNGFALRWLTVCRAIRDWGIEHPNEYALIYGSPVPGYHAPEERTVPPATRVAAVLGGQLDDASRAGVLQSPLTCPALPPSVAEAAKRVRDVLGAQVPDDMVARGLMAWTYIFGAVTFELFGHWKNTVGEYSEFFDYTVDCMRQIVGLPEGDF